METAPGPCVLLTVADNGVGMDDETSSRVFEPFFTTKEPGKGTGLGLSTVHGIVKQSGGSVFLYSRPGEGTALKIYLPRVDKPARMRAAATPQSDSMAGSETILVVEDEIAVQELVRRVLERFGYSVFTCRTADEALRLLQVAGSPIDLLLTDVVLPGRLQGNELAREAGVLRPRLPVLYMSGYTRNAIVRDGRLDEGVNYMEKPFTPEKLVWRVRRVLDSRPASE